MAGAAPEPAAEATQVRAQEGRWEEEPGEGPERPALTQGWLTAGRGTLPHHSLAFKDSKLKYKESVNMYVCFDMENHSHLFLIHLRKGDRSEKSAEMK